ncbi:MAG: Crp/Fnr family transcriptional regulator [Alphaproteobacteria bacterium]
MTDTLHATVPYATAVPAHSTRVLAPGQALFRSGDPVTDMYVVAKGTLRLQRHLDDGRLVPVSRASSGETVAEASLFAGHYHCDCIADGAAAVSARPRADVLAALRAVPDEALALLQHLAHQVQDLRGRVEVLTLHGAAPRILAYVGLRADLGGTWAMDRTWKAVAEEVGLTHEALYRALARLQRAGLIVRQERTVTLVG